MILFDSSSPESPGTTTTRPRDAPRYIVCARKGNVTREKLTMRLLTVLFDCVVARIQLLRSPVARALLPAISLMAVPGAGSFETRASSVAGPSPGKSGRRPIAVDIPIPPERPDRRNSSINIVTNPTFDSRMEQPLPAEESL